MKYNFVIPFHAYENDINDLVELLPMYLKYQTDIIDYRIIAIRQLGSSPYSFGWCLNAGFNILETFGDNKSDDLFVFHSSLVSPERIDYQPVIKNEAILFSNFPDNKQNFDIGILRNDDFTLINGFTNRSVDSEKISVDFLGRLRHNNVPVIWKQCHLSPLEDKGRVFRNTEKKFNSRELAAENDGVENNQFKIVSITPLRNEILKYDIV